jgi:hypothetical protein
VRWNPGLAVPAALVVPAAFPGRSLSGGYTWLDRTDQLDAQARVPSGRRDYVQEAPRREGPHVHRCDIRLGEQALDDRLELDLIRDHRVVVVVHCAVAPIGAQNTRAGGQLLGQSAGLRVAAALHSVNIDRPGRGEWTKPVAVAVRTSGTNSVKPGGGDRLHDRFVLVCMLSSVVRRVHFRWRESDIASWTPQSPGEFSMR